MASKNDTEVIIGGKVFTLSGYESEEYLQKVALYVNSKAAEYKKIDSYRRQSLEVQAILMQLNIADDYFKAKKQVSKLQDDVSDKGKEISDLKHELVSAQIRLESMEKTMKSMHDDLNEKDRKLARLEMELKAAKSGKSGKNSNG